MTGAEGYPDNEMKQAAFATKAAAARFTATTGFPPYRVRG